MTWDELSAEQKAIWSAYENDLRALSGEFQRWCNKAAALDVRFKSQAFAILNALDTGVIPPNTSGLAGTSALDAHAETNSLVLYQQWTMRDYNTQGHQELRAKACGQANA